MKTFNNTPLAFKRIHKKMKISFIETPTGYVITTTQTISIIVNLKPY